MAKNDFKYGRRNSYTLQCGSGIVTVNSPSGSTGCDFDHITAVDVSFCTSLRNFIQIGPQSAEKNDVMSIFKMVDLGPLGFYGSNNGFFEKPMYDFL